LHWVSVWSTLPQPWLRYLINRSDRSGAMIDRRPDVFRQVKSLWNVKR
jgi:hypothetical protein